MVEITKKLKLDLSKVPPNKKAEVKREVGEFIVEEILRRTADGKSPLKNAKRWKRLDPVYAREEKGGDRTPNLELTGDMLDTLKSKNREGDVIEVGLHTTSEKILDRADGHNNFSGKSKLPLRRFIPGENEEFNRDIMRGVKRIIRGYEGIDIQEREAGTDEPILTTSVTTDNILSRDAVAILIEELLNGQ